MLFSLVVSHLSATDYDALSALSFVTHSIIRDGIVIAHIRSRYVTRQAHSAPPLAIPATAKKTGYLPTKNV